MVGVLPWPACKNICLSCVNEGCVLDKTCCPKLLHKKMETERYDGNRVLSDLQRVVLGKSATLKHEMMYLFRGLFIEGKLTGKTGR